MPISSANGDQVLDTLIAELRDTRRVVKGLLQKQAAFQEAHYKMAKELSREMGEIGTSYDSLSKMATYVNADVYAFKWVA